MKLNCIAIRFWINFIKKSTKKYMILLYSKTYLLNKKQFKKAIKNKVNKQLLKEKKFIEILEIH